MAVLNHLDKLISNKVSVINEVMGHNWESPLNYCNYLKTLGNKIQKHVKKTLPRHLIRTIK